LSTNHEELLALIESAPDLILTQDLRGRLTRVNRAFERVTGYSRTQAIGRSFTDFLIPDDRARVHELLISQTGGALPRSDDYTIITAKGESVRLEICWQLAFDEGKPVGWRAFAHDVRERDRQLSAKALAETRLVETSNELAKFTRHLQLLHRLSNTNYDQLDALANSYLAAGCEIFETPYGILTQITGRSFTFCDPHNGGSRIGCEERLDLQSHLVTQILGHRATSVLTGPAAGDTPFSFFIGAPILLNENAHGTITFWNTRDMNPGPSHPQGREVIELMAKRIGLWMEQRRLTDELAHQAHHDALTGLPNRLFLRNRLHEALQQVEKTSGKLAVLFIDLDRFKQINDTLGHTVGDALLQQVAARLKTCMAGTDILARMGGDEFTAILTGFHEIDEAIHRARRLLHAVRKASSVEGYELFVSASIGLAFYPRDGRDAATLLRNADTAMYTAKYRGKNQIHCYSDEGVDSAFERLELEHSLRPALEKSEFGILFQPQVDVAATDEDLRLSGLEVLLIWDHPKLGRISPTQFIPIAEESGMILQIGLWVMREACMQAVRWQTEGHPLVRISVNVSALQFAQENFVVTVAKILRESGLDPNWLELELTESLVMQDVEQAVSRMAELRSIGVRIAIDDFGTGYSSLSYLRRLPADTLKIDRSFLEEGGYGPGALALIQTIVILAHNMGLSVTAEGVETVSHLDLVQKAGCDHAQGHLFGGGLDAKAVEGLFRHPEGLFGALFAEREAKE
jgi:diguanylate cyclase (GGDEF)-like protein/PAS domain S-box-containing protein